MKPEDRNRLILNTCPKCKETQINEQRFIIYCRECNCEMERSELSIDPHHID
jgi:hypothetical protein